MSENKINPDKFLEYVHDIDLSIINKNLKLNRTLKKSMEQNISLQTVLLSMLKVFFKN